MRAELAPTRADTGFERFFRTELPGVLACLYGLTGSWHVAEDLAQEAFLRTYVRWREIRTLDRPDAWVRRVAESRDVAMAATRCRSARGFSSVASQERFASRTAAGGRRALLVGGSATASWTGTSLLLEPLTGDAKCGKCRAPLRRSWTPPLGHGKEATGTGVGLPDSRIETSRLRSRTRPAGMIAIATGRLGPRNAGVVAAKIRNLLVLEAGIELERRSGCRAGLRCRHGPGTWLGTVPEPSVRGEPRHP